MDYLIYLAFVNLCCLACAFIGFRWGAWHANQRRQDRTTCAIIRIRQKYYEAKSAMSNN